MFQKIITSLKHHLSYLTIAGIIVFLQQNIQTVLAQTLPGLPGEVVTKTGLQTVNVGGDGIDKFIFFVRQTAIPNLKVLFISIGIVILLYYAFQFIIATSTDDADTQKTNLLWAAGGFILMGLAANIVEIIAPGAQNNLQDIGSIQAAQTVTQKVILFIQYIVGGIAVLFIIIAAVRLITAQGVEDEIDKQKKNFVWGAFGLITILLSEVAVNMFYDAGDNLNQPVLPGELAVTSSNEIFGIITFVLQFLGIISVVALVSAGIYYVISAGDEEKTARAKRIILYTIMGIVVIYMSYAVVAFFGRSDIGIIQ